MSWVTWGLISLFATVLALVGALLIPVPDPDKHPFDADPLNDDGEHRGRHRHPEDDDGGTVPLASPERPLWRPFVD